MSTAAAKLGSLFNDARGSQYYKKGRLLTYVLRSIKIMVYNEDSKKKKMVKLHADLTRLLWWKRVVGNHSKYCNMFSLQIV